MTQDEARDFLNDLVASTTIFTFPIHDAVCQKLEVNDELDFDDFTQPAMIFKDYSFRELLKTAYNLTEKE